MAVSPRFALAVDSWLVVTPEPLNRNVNKIIVGNKCDVDESARQVQASEGRALAEQYNVQFFETSAKANIGVSEAFDSITRDVVTRLSKEGGGGDRGGGFKPPNPNPSKSRSCC